MTAPSEEIPRAAEGYPSGDARRWSLDDLDAGRGGEPPDPVHPRRPRHRVRRTLLTIFVVLAVLAAVPLGFAWYLEHRLTSQIHRVDGVFSGLREADRPNRPAPGTPGAGSVNVLLLGTDAGSVAPTDGDPAGQWQRGNQRSDTMMVLHLDASRRVAAVVSIPRDSWVSIPGHGDGKLNWAYSEGGPSLAVATVERLTGLRIDHLAIVDWAGFEELTDHIGGVDVDVPDTVTDPRNHVTWTAGRHHLDGAQALLYVRQRYGLPNGDFDRMRRQQAFLRAVVQGALQQEMRHDPRLLYGFLATVARNLSIDSGWSSRDMARLAISLRDFRSANMRFVTAPVLGTGRVGSQSVVRLDPAGGAQLWHDLRSDRIDQWSATHWQQLTGEVVG